MDEFRRTVFYEGVWRATLAVVSAAILMICFNASVTGALLIGANVALLFALGMMLYASQIARERPYTAKHVDTSPLRFAQGGAGVAAALSGSALVI
jgi:ABC-type microcin C transport system permease subunit YejB